MPARTAPGGRSLTAKQLNEVARTFSTNIRVPAWADWYERYKQRAAL